MNSRRLLPVALSVSACAFGLGLIWSQRATSAITEQPQATQPQATPLPSREVEELDRVVQARFAIIPKDGSFGFNRIRVIPPGGIHGDFYPASKTEIAAVDALKRTHQQVAFFLVGRTGIADKFKATAHVHGPVIMSSRIWQIKEDFPAVEAKYKDMVANAPSKAQLCALAAPVFTGGKPSDASQTQIREWHIVARPIEASSEECVTCHNSMARKAAELAKTLIESPDLVSLHDPLGVALYCVRTAPKSLKRTQGKKPDNNRRLAESTLAGALDVAFDVTVQGVLATIAEHHDSDVVDAPEEQTAGGFFEILDCVSVKFNVLFGVVAGIHE